MKKLLMSGVAFAMLSGAALAADLPVRSSAPIAPSAPILTAAPVFTWTGFYVGVNAGYGWNANDSITIGDVTYDLDEEGGFVGGAQAGYNYQIGSFVVGVEGDIQYADFGGTGSFDTDGDLIPDTDFDRNDWFGTVRARAGVAFDRALVYATGGFAFADDANGWTVGGGVEYAFTNNLTAKVEGLYVNLDLDNNLVDDEAEFGVIRAGLNYKFSTY